MNWGKAAGRVGALAATVATGMVNPSLGIAVGSSFFGAGAVKSAGKRMERSGIRPIHHIGSPLAAVGLPVALAQAGIIDGGAICATVARLCETGGTPALVGAVAVLVHQLWSGAGKTRTG